MSDTPPTVIGQLKAKLTAMTAERDALLVERNHLHRLALELAKELQAICGCHAHAAQVAELENMSKGK